MALSVANSASTAELGCVGVSTAITVTPASRAASIAGTTASEAGAMRMPCAPRRVMSSSAATWLSLSTSLVPVAVSSSTLLSPAVFSAVSRILTQNGFSSCLVMRPTVTSSSSSPHAATPRPSATAAPSAIRRALAMSVRPLDDERAALGLVRRSNSA